MKYQEIKIGNVNIEGKDRYPEYKKIFEYGVENDTILDIGCNIGFYCLQASTDKAKYCLGIDNCRAFINDANMAKHKLKIDNVDFVVSDVLEYNIPKKFDYVLCLNFLHNMPTIYIMNKIIYLCDECSLKKMVFSIIQPSNYKMVSVEKNSNGVDKICVSRKFFRNRFPKYTIKTYKSVVTEGRTIVEVIK